MRLFLLLIIIVAIALILGLSACKSTPSAPTPSPAPAQSPLVTGKTIGELAQTGGSVFANRCSRCHGGNGQGGVAPAIIGEKAKLAEYQNAGELYRIVSTGMPKNAPGQLSQEEYAQVVSYLLLQNGFSNGTLTFNTGELVQIPLKQ